jgi:UDP-2-acetamido-3-amino-2,3-dideoxy-glucuronate N-acetyltransferase
MKIAVIGCGHWGKNLVRNFYELDCLYAICDNNCDKIDSTYHDNPKIKLFEDFDLLIADPEIDGVVIATPSNTHFEFAKKAILANKNVYVEKPLAQKLSEAQELQQLAEEKDLVLMVGHLLLYHPAVNKLKQIIENGELGEIQYLNSDRRNFNKNQGRHANVMWDLAPHDFSMMSYILSLEPSAITNVKAWSSKHDDEIDVVHIDFVFPGNIGAHIHNSWLDPQKQALLTVNGSKKTAVLNDTFKQNKLELYSMNEDGSLTVERPIYSNDEPLRLECKHFIDCIENNLKPTSGGANGTQIVSYLEECQNSISANNENLVLK